MSNKGYVVAGAKDDDNTTSPDSREEMKHVTVAPLGQERVGMVTSNLGTFRVSQNLSLTAAGSDTSIIVFDAPHNALRGDLIRFTNTVNGISKSEHYTKEIIDANTIKIHGVLDAAIDDADTVDLLRAVTPRYNDDGTLIATLTSSPITINKGPGGTYVEAEITKDTTVAANTIALPVEIVGTSGTEINITAGDINVQLTHAGANPDSVQLGDGTVVFSAGRKSAATSLPVVISTEDTAIQAAIAADLVLLEAKDFSTETTLAAQSAKLPATLGQKASAASMAVSLSSEQEAILSGTSAKLPATLGQKASAASMSVALSTEQESIQTAIRDRLPTSLGQKARASALATTLSTEDMVVIGSIRDRLPASIGQKADAASLAVTLSTEQDALLTNVSNKLTSIESTHSTASLQASMSAKLPATLGPEASAASLSVTLSSDEGDLPIGDLDVIASIVVDLNGVTDAAYTQIIASTSAPIKAASIFMSSGRVLELSTGAAASEVLKMHVAPGGWVGQRVGISIATATRLSVKFTSGEGTGGAGERAVIVFMG